MIMRNPYLEQKPDVEELITSHMELVRQIAWHMRGRVHSSVEIEDLIQIGYYGLVTAAQNYTLREGATFASYAGIRIRGAIVDHLRKSSNLWPIMQNASLPPSLVVARPVLKSPTN